MENTALVAIVCGLLAAIGWGVADFIGAKASRQLSPILSAFIVNTVGTLAFALVFAVFLRGTWHMNSTAFWYATGGGAAIALGAMAFYKALKIGPVSLVTPLGASYPLVTTALAVFLFSAGMSVQQITGVCAIVAGVMIASELVSKQGFNRIGKGSAYALLCALGWGTGYSLVAQATQRVGWESATLVEFIAIVATFVLCLPLVHRYETVSFKSIARIARTRIVIVTGLVQVAAALLFNIGLSKDPTSGALVSALSACFPVLTIFLALRHFGEKFDPIPLGGAILSVVGVVILSV